MQPLKLIAVLVACTWGLSLAADAEAPPTVKALLEKVTSEDLETRYSSRSEAPAVGAAAVSALSNLIDESTLGTSSDDKILRHRREVALTARSALEKIVHHAARPGARAERQTVASELARVLTPDRTPKVKRELLYLVGLVGGDDEVPAVAKLLDDEDANVRETARLVLERMRGPASTQALLRAARTQAADRKPDLLLSLGMKKDPRAVPVLVEIARSESGSVRFAALKALAHLGAVEAVPVFTRILQDKNLPERGQLFGEFLRLADELRDASQLDEAREVYLLVLKQAPMDHQRERALYRASAGGASTDAGDLNVLLAGLSDPAMNVRDLALSRLGSLSGKELLETLLEAYDRAELESRAALLRVIAEKDLKAAEPLLAEATKSDRPELKLTALDIQGKLDDPALSTTYLQVAESGSPLVQPVALKGLRLLAGKSLEDGDTKAALRMYGRALDLSTTSDEKSKALAGLIQIGDPQALDQVAALLQDSALASEAAEGVLQLALKMGAAGDKDGAEKHLMPIVTGNFPRDLRHKAAETLRQVGRDPQKAVRNQGFIVNWWVVTPIADPDGKGLEKEFFPEKEIVLEGVQQHDGRKFRWQNLTEVSLDGQINLLTSFRKTDKVLTYAYTTIKSPEDQDVIFKMGSDDGIACWLNDRRIHLNNAARSLQVDQDTVKARLQAGENKILLKISNGSGDWAFAFRITDAEGKPVNLWDR